MKNTKNMDIESPNYNKKSKTKFIITMLLLFILGGVGGFFGAKIFRTNTTNLHNIGQVISENLPFFQLNIIPIILIILIIVCLVLGLSWIKKAKKQINTWDGENDEHIEITDTYLNKISIMSNILTIFSEILFALGSYQLLNLLKTKNDAIIIIVFVIIYLSAISMTVYFQSQTVKLVQLYAPEKKGSIYDKNFQKIWYESCDEAERQLIGIVSHRTFIFMNTVFSTFLTITILLGMFIPIGFLCSFFIGILWLIMSFYYGYSCEKLEKRKS